MSPINIKKKKKVGGRHLGGSGHDLKVCGFEPCVRLCADSSEPAAFFGFCVSLSLSLPLLHLHSVYLSQK